MKITILTIFPGMFEGPFGDSIVRSARDNGLLDIEIVDIRHFATDRHRTVDDYPFGGGPGMVMKPEPIFLAVESVLDGKDRSGLPVILISPQGRPFTQKVAGQLAREPDIVLICGHYKGVDERVRLHLASDEISIGDFVISGGEIAAMAIVDAVARMLPGALGDFASAETDTFYNGLLEWGNYTRPRQFRGHAVPDILLSGNHEEIARWRRRDSLRKTLARRPDLLAEAHLSDSDVRILDEIRAEECSN
jgi:tRNA (guanine37-N1)-methyltransferase